MKTLTVLIPCYNEEKGIGQVIESIPIGKLQALDYRVEVLVVDNNSHDNTVRVARSKGARIVHEKRQGKGHAISTGFKNVSDNTDIVVMLDGDNTYQSCEMLRMIEPIDSGFCDVVVGTRLSGKMSKESMTYFNRIGNWLFTFLVRVCFAGNVTDVCTGYFAWKKEVVDELAMHIESKGFSLEMEMVTKMAKLGYSIYSVPITYTARAGTSSLRPIKDGSLIIYTWFTNLFWNNPGKEAKYSLEVPDARDSASQPDI
ncbi:MAG: glycosyltransferase family 2 protein [Candidatus Woesearchaeota archaeon]